jgi:hypothetical protein
LDMSDRDSWLRVGVVGGGLGDNWGDGLGHSDGLDIADGGSVDRVGVSNWGSRLVGGNGYWSMSMSNRSSVSVSSATTLFELAVFSGGESEKGNSNNKHLHDWFWLKNSA